MEWNSSTKPIQFFSANCFSICIDKWVNLFFKPDIWTGTGFEQHIKNKSTAFWLNEELIVENDEIQNNFGEHKNEHAILEYDPTWYDTTDLDENESDSGDENNKYMKPSCNNSNLDVGVGYTSINNHREAHPIDEPIKAFFFKHNFMNFPK